jgi:glycerophosphoryl diester phosphodiesterase
VTVKLRAEGGKVVLVAHRGAPGVAPENTLAGIEAALAYDVDVVEVDVSERGGDLVLAHSDEVAAADSPTLDEAVAFFAARARPEVAIQLDLKPRGAEGKVVQELREHDLLERALVSSTFPDVLRAVRALEPGLPTGLGYPYDRARVTERGLLPEAVVRGALTTLRAALPPRVVRMARSAEADVLTLHHLVVSAASMRRCRAHGIGVFAWTVNDPETLGRVLALGVDGVVTDDPALVRP